MTVKNNLRKYQPKGVERWEKLIDLHEQIEKAVKQLRVLNAEASLHDDFELVSALVGKLTPLYQEEWDKYSVENDDQSTALWPRFWSWLDGVNDRAVASKLRNMAAGGTPKVDTPTCPKCKTKHRVKQKCPNVGDKAEKTLPIVHGHLTLAKVQTKDQLKEYKKSALEFAGKCPVCNKPHQYERKFSFGTAQIPSHRLDSCPGFKAMSPKQRGELLETKKACWSCLDWLHEGKDCIFKDKTKCDVKVGNTECSGVHHKPLHDS